MTTVIGIVSIAVLMLCALDALLARMPRVASFFARLTQSDDVEGEPWN